MQQAAPRRARHRRPPLGDPARFAIRHKRDGGLRPQQSMLLSVSCRARLNQQWLAASLIALRTLSHFFEMVSLSPQMDGAGEIGIMTFRLSVGATFSASQSSDDSNIGRSGPCFSAFSVPFRSSTPHSRRKAQPLYARRGAPVCQRNERMKTVSM